MSIILQSVEKKIIKHRFLATALLLGVGFLIRSAGIMLAPPTNGIPIGEPLTIALNLAQSGAYANPFGASGPSAHCPPGYPLVGALIFKLLGFSKSSVIVLRLFSALVASASFALLLPIGLQIGIPATLSFAAAAVGVFIPVNFLAQTSGQFDAAFSTLFLTVGVFWIAKSHSPAFWSIPRSLAFGLLVGVAALFNPVPALTLGVWIGVMAMTKSISHQRVGLILVVALSTLAPWAIRNYITFDEWIWTRDNFGLELDISNNDTAKPVLEENMLQYFKHPYSDHQEAIKVKQMGEPAYSRMRFESAKAWIRQNPLQFAELTAKRIYRFWIPAYPRVWQTIIAVAESILGIAGILWFASRYRHNAFFFMLCVLVVFPLTYYIVQASGRYRFPIEPVLLLGATGLFFRPTPEAFGPGSKP